MAFNLGAFAGGFAQGGLNTYKLISDIDSQKKRDELLDLQMRELRNKIEEEQKIRQVGKDVFSQVGQEDVSGALPTTTGIGQRQAAGLTEQSAGAGADFEAYDREQLARTLRGNAAYQNQQDVQARMATPDSGARPAGLPTSEEQRAALLPKLATYTRDQAETDYANRVRAINYERGTAAEAAALGIKSAKQNITKGGLEISALEREKKFNDDFDATMKDWQQNSAFKLRQDFDKTLVDDGVSGVLKKFGPEFKKATGNDVALVGNEIHVSRGGKVVEKFPTTELQAKMEPLLAQKAMTGLMDTMVAKGLFRNSSEVLTFFKTQGELRNQGIQADAAMIKALAEQQKTPSEVAKNNAAAGYYNRGGASANRQTAGEIMEEKIDALAKVFIEANPNMDPKMARQRAAQVITRDPDAKPAVTASDINNFLKDQAGSVVSKDKNTGKPVRLGDLPLQEQRAIAIEILGGKSATSTTGGLPDLGEGGLGKPGAPAAATAASTNKAQPTSLTQRLTQAINADNANNTRSNFRALSDEVAKQYSLLSQQAATLRVAIPKSSPEAQKILADKLAGIEADFPIMESILGQRKALRTQGLMVD